MARISFGAYHAISTMEREAGLGAMAANGLSARKQQSNDKRGIPPTKRKIVVGQSSIAPANRNIAAWQSKITPA
jgi:hypothetical protein